MFEVKVETGLNSGVQIRSRSRTAEDSKAGSNEGRYFGPQVEIESSPGQAGYVYGEAMGTGWLSPEPKSKDKAVNQHSIFRNDEWNHYRIVAKGPRIQTFINGIPVADVTDEKAYASHPRGSIGLQVHSVGPNNHPKSVSWRRLYIRDI